MISSENIADIMLAEDTGHTVITFTDLSKDDLINFYMEKNENLPLEIAKTMFDNINVINTKK